MTPITIIAFTDGLPQWVIMACVFGGIVTFVYFLSDFFFGSKTKAESRLEQLSGRNGGEETQKQSIGELLQKHSPKFSEALKPKSEKEINALQTQLNHAGFRSEGAPQALATLKVFGAIGGLALGAAIGLGVNGFNLVWVGVYAMVGGVLFMMLPSFALGFIAGSRKQKIFLGLPDALDLMTVCVEAGLGMDQALRRVAEEMENTHPTVAHEFQICNRQLQYGSTRDTVLTELGERNGVDDLQTLASVMIQVDKFGTSVGKALRVQSDAMRTRRRQIAEEKAAKTAVKLIFPLVLFIFPGIFVVLVGPAAITMMEQFEAMGVN